MKLKKTIKFSIALLFLFTSLVLNRPVLSGTSGILVGTVLDKETKQPLPGVNIIISETDQGAATDINGFFRIYNIRAGTYTVEILMIGYQKITYRNITILPDLRTRLNAELTQSAIEMQEIEVRAERPLIQTDITGTAYEISSYKIEKLPIDKFEQVVGLQAGTTIEGNIRGGKTREVVYFVDGLPVQDVIRGGLGTDLPKSAISQLTVKTGGLNAEFGNALSGVVNVITRTGQENHQFFFRADKDNLFGGEQVSKTNDIEFMINGPVKKRKLFYFTSNNLYLSDTRWWQDMQHFFDSSIQKEFKGLSKIDWLISPSKRLSTQFLYSLSQWRDYEFSWRFNLNGLPPRKRNSYRGALFWTHTLSKNSFYSISLSQYQLHSKIGDEKPDNEQLEPYQYDFYLLYIVEGNRYLWADMKQYTTSLKTDFTSQFLDNHLFKMGFEFKQYNIKSNTLKLEPQLTYFGKPLIDAPLLNYSSLYHYYPRSGSIYIQDKFESPKSHSVINAGIRFDFLDPRAKRPAIELIPISQNEYEENIIDQVPAKIQYHFSPRIGLAVPFTPDFFFFVNFGHYFQFPLFDYLYSGLDNVNLQNGIKVLRGNPSLLAERTRAWEISARYNIYENIVASLVYFSKETYDQIDSKTFVPYNSRIAGDYGFAEYVNNPYAIATGYEFVLTREKGKWVRGNLSYTLMEAKGLSDNEHQGLNYEQWGFPLVIDTYYLSWDQRHTLKADLLFDLPYSTTANVVWQYHSGRPYTYYPSSDGFHSDDTSRYFIPNNRRMPGNNYVNIKISKEFPIDRFITDSYFSQTKLSLYVDINNIFNDKNVRWIDSSGRTGGELNDPSAYHRGRRTAVGMQIEF